ncbi:hypothetical protein [Streptomyces canus]|uniref:hypothetical protein n=1 Tax=Streptomyces canus TaxID=58343 RepID=UPI00386B3E7F|nr:hypothetical protein OH824_17775 [Streptomyces canus]
MERTQPDPVDEGLRVLLTEPTYAAQVLIVTARMLEMDPAEPMTGRAGGMAMNIATDTVLTPLPQAVRDDSIDRATRVLPDLSGITRGEAALRLRAAAEVLG